MLYLLCLKPLQTGGYRKDYTEITPEIESKITRLIRANKMPPTFVLHQKTIYSEEILGYTDNPIPGELYLPESQSKIKSWDELSDWVRQQPWYRRSSRSQNRKLRPEEEAPSENLL